MSAAGTPKASEAAVAAVQDALIAEGAGPGNSIHSWRCEHPDRYGPCDCVAEVARAAADAAAPHIAAQALRDAASAWQSGEGFTVMTPRLVGIPAIDYSQRALDWLRDRANRIEAGQ